MNKKFTGLLLAVMGLLVLTSCVSADQEGAADAVSQATPKGDGWKIELSGVRSDEVWESNLKSWIAQNPELLVELEYEKKDELHSYEGVPLKEIIAMVDDADGSMPASFRAEKWTEGYELTLTAGDGYAQTMVSSDFDPDDLYLGISQDGSPMPPTLIGDISGQYWVRDLASISLGLQPVSLETNDFELLLDIDSKNASFTISEMENHPYYMEDKGNYTNSYGNNFQYTWGGVKLVDLINDYTTLTDEMTVTIQAMDGYEMDYSGSQLLDQEDGTWILAFKENGEYMPEDPGYIRLVKVGPKNPEITGHVSARMVKKIIIREESFSDFQITLDGPAGMEVFDRQTMQSGVSTHKSVVSYFDKKSESSIEYMGLPLYEMFSRYDGIEEVTLKAEDGFAITLAASEVIGNQDVILAMYYGDGSELSDKEKPLVIVWDQNAPVVPEGIKAVRKISKLIIR